MKIKQSMEHTQRSNVSKNCVDEEAGQFLENTADTSSVSGPNKRTVRFSDSVKVGVTGEDEGYPVGQSTVSGRTHKCQTVIMVKVIYE